jgi:hypothetical protein
VAEVEYRTRTAVIHEWFVPGGDARGFMNAWAAAEEQYKLIYGGAPEGDRWARVYRGDDGAHIRFEQEVTRG